MSKNTGMDLNYSKIVDLSNCVPKKLYERLKNDGIHMPCKKDDAFEEDKEINFRKILLEIDSAFNSDDLTEDSIVEVLKQAERKSYVLNIEPITGELKICSKNSDHLKQNWTTEYVKKMKKERIIWQTKLFKENDVIREKPLFEMTEELIDIAGEFFIVDNYLT
jgi:hypothetical protein